MKHLFKMAMKSISNCPLARYGLALVIACTFANGANAQEDAFSKTFEAEKAVTSGAVVQTTYVGFNCTGYVAFPNSSNDYLEWQVIVPTAGEYAANFRYAFGSSGAGPLKVEVNGGVVGSLYPFFSTGSWTNWQINTLNVVLKAGVNYLRLTSNGYATPVLDHVQIVTSGAPADVPTTSDCQEPFSRYFEAESAQISGAIVAALHPGYAYTGYVDFQNASTDYVEWTFDLPVAGWYEYAFRYAYSGAGARPLKIEVNGNTVASFYPFYATGSWSTWKEASLGASFLQGLNTIRLTAVGYSGPNVDNLRVYQLPITAAGTVEGGVATSFPNPAIDVLNVKFRADIENADVRLLSREGVDKPMRLLRKDAEGASFDVSSVAPGWYVLQIQRGKTVETKQIRIK